MFIFIGNILIDVSNHYVYDTGVYGWFFATIFKIASRWKYIKTQDNNINNGYYILGGFTLIDQW